MVICACPVVAGTSKADKKTDTQRKGVVGRPKDATKGTCVGNLDSCGSPEGKPGRSTQGSTRGSTQRARGYDCSIFGTEHMQRFCPAALTLAVCFRWFAGVCLACARRNKKAGFSIHIFALLTFHPYRMQCIFYL